MENEMVYTKGTRGVGNAGRSILDSSSKCGSFCSSFAVLLRSIYGLFSSGSAVDLD